ncbi:alpha-glucuronidase [Brachybacterium sp. AOP24-D1-21]|uniref:alpha-glucuronidase n=1 Tax=Brachybacterium sp. AOP24-D1-21 TaxID=3457711 RepID=UPI0040339921
MSPAPAERADHAGPAESAGPAEPADHAGIEEPADLAWLGAHAAARLPREVQLHAGGPLAGTVGAEVERLRDLAEGTAGTLRLYDLPAARDAGIEAAVLEELAAAGPEAYALRVEGEHLCVIAGGDRGLLHGFYAVVLGQATAVVHTTDAADATDSTDSTTGTGSTAGWTLRAPAQAIRMLDHWDNMTVHSVMGQVERGYAGGSLFYEDGELREDLTRVEQYARLLASIGINRVSLNNVNVHAREATLLTSRLNQVARLAEVFRGQGISVHLAVSFASPILLGGLTTSDPLDAEVQDWWAATAEAVYAAIPDFGGFVVKADSEGQPGPFAYGRDHTDGANLLARALAPHGGEVFWRAFVYDHHQDWRDRSTDRARAAHDHFAPLDGTFDDNVIVQVKHGPLDFQVREAVSPVIGAMPRTRLAVELQITQEYTGQQKHLCYLAPWWSENLRFPFGNSDPAAAEASAPTVAQIVAGTAERPGGVVAVSNVGADAFWTGHPLAQANLFALGRLAWDPDLSPQQILEEWIGATFGADPLVAEVLEDLLGESWQLYESYTAPLGVGFMVRPGHHYGPDVDGYEYTPWGTYHFADRDGLGVDRTVATGTGFAGLFPEPWASLYESPQTCPDELLLFFHHVPYTHRLHSGKTVIQHIYDSRADGYERVLQLRPRWQELEGRVPTALHERVTALLHEQERSAEEWRDQLRTYFFRASGIPDESGRPIH